MNHGLTNLSRPKLLNHLVKGAIFGWAAYQFAMPLRGPDVAPLGVVLWGSAAWFCLAGLLRNLHALVVFPVLQASPEALRLRYWKPSRIFTWSMFLPFNRVVEATIPWSNYRGCRTSIISGGDPWDGWQRLLVETDRDFHEIGWDVFAGSITRQMDAILDYRQELLRGPYKSELAAADFQRLRFAQPVRLEQKVHRGDWSDFGCFIFLVPLMLVMAGAAGVAITMFGSLGFSFVCRSLGLEDLSRLFNRGMDDVETPLGKMPWLVLIGAVGGIVVMVVWFMRTMWKEAGIRLLELRADGLAYGSKPHSLTLIPWEDVLYAGVMTETTYRGEGAAGSSDHVEVRCRGRSTLVLKGNYGRSSSDILEMIDPPVDKLSVAREAMRRGQTIEQAVAAAGLPAGSPVPAS